MPTDYTDELLNVQDALQDRVTELESAIRDLADTLAAACNRLERVDARLLRITEQANDGPLGEVTRGRAAIDRACSLLLGAQR